MSDFRNSDFSLNRFGEVRRQLQEYIVPTPLLRSQWLSLECRADVFLKMESFQRTHSFKVRGAFGALLPKLEQARRKGAVTGSSGNFARGLAYACRELAVPLKVVMLDSSASNKVEAARALGAEIVFCADDFALRTETVNRIASEEGRILVHSFDDSGTILGNGSVGLEILEDLPDPDVVLAPASGGGILAGVGTVVKQSRPDCRVYGVQPEANPSMRASLEKGEPTTITSDPSICDGLIATRPGDLTFRLVQQHVEGIFTVADAQVARAVKGLLEEEKLLVEPSGAAGVAALLVHMRDAVGGKKIVAVITGGNLSLSRLPGILALAEGAELR